MTRLLAIALLFSGCAARKPVETRLVRVNGGTKYVAYPVIGAPPVWEQGRWKCGNSHYAYTNLRCELKAER